TTSVLLAERRLATAQRQQTPEQNNDDNDTAQSSKLGVSVQTVTPEIAPQLKLKIQSGAVVTSVDGNVAAGQLGISSGDVIHRVGGTDIKSAADLIKASKSLKSGEDVMIQLERGGTLQFITLNID